MFNVLRKKASALRVSLVAVLLMMAAVVYCGTGASAAELSTTVSTNRSNGVCSYTVNGIDVESTSSMILKVTRTNSSGVTETALEKQISLDASNCVNGTYTGNFTLAELSSYTYDEYTVSFVFGDLTVTSPEKCDFSVHTDKYTVKVTGGKSSANRSFSFVSTESSDDVIVPGTDNQIKLAIYKNGNDASAAVDCGVARDLTNVTRTWDVDLTTICSSYGKYYARFMLVNKNLAGGTMELGTAEFNVAVTYSGVGSKKTTALEKKKKFRVYAATLRSALGVKSVRFDLYDSTGKKVYSRKGVHKSGSTYYYTNISLKALNYKFDVYTIKVVVGDSLGNTRTLGRTPRVSVKPKKGSLSIVKFSNATGKFKLKNAYIPGNIKNVKFNVYSIKNGKKTFVKRYFGVYSSKKNLYTATMQFSDTGKYIVYAYGTTQWGTSVMLNRRNFNVKKKDLGKNGWRYETYAGKTYKFYYQNNKKLTDLTEVLKLRKSVNKFKIVVNRAAGCVTVYAYDSQKKAYIIPIKTCTVSVGRDISTVAGPSSLSSDTSFTPIGDFSICTNGIASKYTMKPMHEPDGSTVYARWASHIVGTVYFHAIAVSTDSHYALNPYTYNRLGTPASAGCVRMTVADAKWIYDYAAVGSSVKIVTGNSSKPGPLGKNKTITVSASINYDPTDPAVPNSTKRADYKAGKISGYITSSGKQIGC